MKTNEKLKQFFLILQNAPRYLQNIPNIHTVYYVIACLWLDYTIHLSCEIYTRPSYIALINFRFHNLIGK